MDTDTSQTHLGEIVQVISSGLVVVVDEHCQRQYPFTFDKICSYSGEYPHELKAFSGKGLKEGIMARFTLDAEDKVREVYPASF